MSSRPTLYSHSIVLRDDRTEAAISAFRDERLH